MLRKLTGLEQLEDYQPPYEAYEAVDALWNRALQAAQEAFAAHPTEPPSEQPEMDFDAVSFGAVAKDMTYSAWLPALTLDQRKFLDREPEHSVKVRGPAGSGKTLALELKALKEIERARSHGEHIRILFLTHSWAMAEQVDGALDRLSEWGALPEVDIYPLMTITEEFMPSDHWGDSLRLLGEDSMSDKEFQLERISKLRDEFLKGDWLTFREDVSPAFRARIESPDDGERKALVWDLLIEFACVLGADGILPGAVSAEQRYLRLPRAGWMMSLESDADKRLILHIYQQYRQSLEADGFRTSDQVVNDFLNFLESNAWHYRRKLEGYDLVFIDELHLFNAQERLALNYLTKNPGEYPKMLMALDPRQSPWEVYRDFQSVTSEGEPDQSIEVGLGRVEPVDLSTIYRFTPEILALVTHLHREFPPLDLGADWALDLSRVNSAVPSGPVPTVVHTGTAEAEVAEVLKRAESRRGEGGTGSRVAIAIVHEDHFKPYRQIAERRGGMSVIASREDVVRLQYARKRMIVGPAEYLAGLQFDSVIVAGLPDTDFRGSNVGHRKRVFLSLLYLAVSRASRSVDIVVNDQDGGVPEILQNAARNKIVRLKRGKDV
jgi:hypothetical protein